jgi:dTMP kinase
MKIDPVLLSKFKPPTFENSFFFTFEGVEGSGKTTQIELLTKALSEQYRVIKLREPGGTSFGEKLRQSVLEAKTPLHPLAEAHLFASSRAQLLHEVIIKELSSPGTIVVCDRYLDSSLAYQGVARGLGIETILHLHQDFPLCIVPHLTFFLKASVNLSQNRMRERNLPPDYFESQANLFHQKLVRGYDEVAEIFPERIKVLKADDDKNLISQQILSLVTKVLHANH